MSELITSGSHGNNIFVLRLSDDKLIRKITYNKNSYSYLKNDFNGCQWYELKNNTKIFNPNLYEFKSFLQLDLKLLDAKSVYHLSPLHLTVGYVEKVIKHYINYCKFSKIAPCHGDLTLANILFKSKLPLIIDWEHFYDEGELWGFDIAYLTLSSLILPYLSNKSFCKKDLFIFQKLWSSLKELGVNNDLIHEPISFFNEIFLIKNIGQ